MDDQFRQFFTRKNIGSMLVLAILALGIPLGIKLASQSQFFQSKAAGAAVDFVAPNVEGRNGVEVATAQTVGVHLTPPNGWALTEGGPTTPEADTQPQMTQLKRFYNSTISDHWSTTELQSPAPASPWNFEVSQGYLLKNDDSTGLLSPFYDCTGDPPSRSNDHYNYRSNGCDQFQTDQTQPHTKTLLGYVYFGNKPQTNLLHHCSSYPTPDDAIISIGACELPEIFTFDGGYQGRSLTSANDRSIRPAADTSQEGSFAINPATTTYSNGKPVINLSWNRSTYDGQAVFSGYTIFRTENGGITQTLVNVNLLQNTYTDNSNALVSGRTYNYHIVAFTSSTYYDAGWTGGVVAPTAAPSASAAPRILLQRYYNATTADHWSSTSKQLTSIPAGYAFDTFPDQGWVASEDDGSGPLTPFYDCEAVLSATNHMNTASQAETVGRTCTVIGYLHLTPQTNTTRLYRCYRGSSAAQDHMTSTSVTCEGAAGYVLGPEAWYVFNSQ